MVNKSFINCFRPNCSLESETLGARSLSGSAHDYHKTDSDHKTHRGLRHLVKAIFFHTLLVKKIRRTSSQNNSYASKYKKILSKIKQAPYCQLSTNLQTNDFKKESIHSTCCSSLKSSSSMASLAPLCSSSGWSVISSTSFRRNEYLANKQTKHPLSRKMLIRKSQGLFFFLVCIFSLTCWGKVCAIIFTSTIFMLIPSRVKRVNMPEHGRVGSQETDLKKSLK